MVSTIPNEYALWGLIALVAFVLGALFAWALVRARAHAGGRASRDAEITQFRVERDVLQQRCQILDSEIQSARKSDVDAKRALAAAEKAVDLYKEALDKAQTKVGQMNQEADSLQAQRQAALLDANGARKDLENAKALHEETKKFLDGANQTLTTQFQAISVQVLEQRGKALGEQHVERLGAVVQPLSKHIKDLEDKLTLAETSRAQDRGSLVTMIQNLAAAQTTLQTEASQLAKALRGNVKSRGNWGESLLERVLESSGLVEGQNYRKQVSVRDDEDDKALRPDVIIDLPDARSVVVDSKVSLIAYDRYVNAEDEVAAAQALADHVQAIRTHISDLAGKNYSKISGSGGLDFVLMFVPIEGALAAAMQQRPELQTEALNRKVALVSPMTLHVALRTIEYLWRMDKLSRSMNAIVDKGRLVYDEAVRLGDALHDLGKRLDASQGAYQALRARLLDPSRGIVRRAQELHKLGVAGKSKKKMRDELAAEVDEGDCLDEALSLGIESAEDGGNTENQGVDDTDAG